MQTRTLGIAGVAMVALLVTRVAVASVGLPLTRDALAQQADVVVIGRVVAIGSAVDPAVDGLYTYVTIQPSEILKGLSTSGPLVIKQLGGAIEGRGVHVPGQAHFRLGEEVLLFLGIRTRDRTLLTIGLWQGKWAIEHDVASGQAIAVKREPKSGSAVDSEALSAIRGDLSRVPALDSSRTAAITVAPLETPRASLPYTLNDPPIRWAKPVVPVNVETRTQPGLAGGGLAQIAAAIAQWNAAGSSLTLQNGLRLPARCQSSAGTDILITFDDPCDEISGDESVLAVAAFGYDPRSTQVVNGRTFMAITDAVITTSAHRQARALLTTPPCFQSTIAHEIGHAIGLDHTQDFSALMYATETGACFGGPIPLNADDRAGLLAVYPPGGAPPAPPTPPPGGGTPGQPTVLAATVVGATLQLSWTLAAGAIPTGHRLDFFAGGTLVTSVTVGGVTAVSLPIPPGTIGFFMVRVTSFNGTNLSTPSPPFGFPIGGGGCVGPPPAPVVTGGIVSGTANVNWTAAGATSYILSAGTIQGAANIVPPTNVGSSTGISAPGLPPGFTAWVGVIAVNACGQSTRTDFFVQ